MYVNKHGALIKEMPLMTKAEKEPFKKLNQRLVNITSSEANFIQIEMVYFDLMKYLRLHAQVCEIAQLIEKAKAIQANQYVWAQNKSLTPRNRILFIKKYKNAIRQILLEVLR